MADDARPFRVISCFLENDPVVVVLALEELL
jgi:hypothetical protein